LGILVSHISTVRPMLVAANVTLTTSTRYECRYDAGCSMSYRRATSVLDA